MTEPFRKLVALYNDLIVSPINMVSLRKTQLIQQFWIHKIYSFLAYSILITNLFNSNNKKKQQCKRSACEWVLLLIKFCPQFCNYKDHSANSCELKKISTRLSTGLPKYCICMVEETSLFLILQNHWHTIKSLLPLSTVVILTCHNTFFIQWFYDNFT